MKKKFLFISLIAIVTFVSFSSTALAADFCTVLGSNVMIDEKIPNLVHTIILIIQIAVPVVLVILGMIDLFKAMTSGKDDEMKKAQGLFVKRLISAALVFFVIAIVKLLFSVIGENKTSMWNCIDCFLEGTKACTTK